MLKMQLVVYKKMSMEEAETFKDELLASLERDKGSLWKVQDFQFQRGYDAGLEQAEETIEKTFKKLLEKQEKG